MIVLGIDPSLSNFTAISSNGNREYQIKPKTRGVERLIEIRSKLDSMIMIEATDLVVLEGYSYCSVGLTYQIGELGGIIRVRLKELGISETRGNLLIVPPTKLKKFVTGKGNSKKDELMMRVLKRWGYESKNNDVADAYSLMRYGLDGGIK